MEHLTISTMWFFIYIINSNFLAVHKVGITIITFITQKWKLSFREIKSFHKASKGLRPRL